MKNIPPALRIGISVYICIIGSGYHGNTIYRVTMITTPNCY